MRRDAEHFDSKMSKIEGSGDLGERLIELAQAKRVSEHVSSGEAPSPSKEQREEAPDSGTS